MGPAAARKISGTKDEIVSYDRAVKKRRRGKTVKYDAVVVCVRQ
jgi:hypothetical protein